MKTNWVIVSGDFVRTGGQDRANYELAWHIADRLGEPVDLVAHAVAEPLAHHRLVRFRQVPRPRGKHLLGAPLLARAGRRAAAAACATNAATRTVVNGGNCPWFDVNWVHMVHAALPLSDQQSPLPFRLKHWLAQALNRRAEQRRVPEARVIVTNSERARAALVGQVAVPPERVRVIYLGTDADVFSPPAVAVRRAARDRLGIKDSELVLAFVGALGYVANKGMDTLLAAAHSLNDLGRPWLLLAAGGGRLDYWQARAAAHGIGERVRFLGNTSHVPDLLAAADVLASPTRYDAYGLAVHEALCRGVPAIVSACAGVAERFPDSLHELVLPDPEDAADLAARLHRVAADLPGWRYKVAELGEKLRRRSWADMAHDMVTVIRACPCHN
jgi:glycosyltransferase involved in cell wall biosynthesis